MANRPSFEDRLKDHLTAWASDSTRNLETDGKHGWVLARAQSRHNYFCERWADFLAGKEHRWAHALNSSQAFAVNLFAPAKESAGASIRLWSALWPQNGGQTPSSVSVDVEFNGPGSADVGREHLGEGKQTTQVDIALCASFPDRKHRFILIEVKLRETEFGACRGAQYGGAGCMSLDESLSLREAKCYMAREEKRRYWKVLQAAPHPLRFDDIWHRPCPWRGSLYQVMRNWAFGQALVANKYADDFRVGLCVHAGNDRVRKLAESVAGHSDVFDAFDALTPDSGLIRVDPPRVVDVLEQFAPRGWGNYMRSRYMLDD